TLKGLPSSYQRDLQEDKEALFAAHDQIASMLHVAAGAVSAMGFNESNLAAASANPALLATEAADYLVKKGIPFRQAHDLVGKLLREAERQAKPWTPLSPMPCSLPRPSTPRTFPEVPPKILFVPRFRSSNKNSNHWRSRHEPQFSIQHFRSRIPPRGGSEVASVSAIPASRILIP